MRPSASSNLIRQSRGFTMTELLVVIGIISVLAAILFPTMSRMRSKADNSRCIGNLKQIGVLTAVYVSENNGLLPWSSGYNYTGSGANSWGWDNRMSSLAVMAAGGPDDIYTSEWFFRPGDHHIFNCPSERNLYRTYTANINLMGFLPGGWQRVPYAAVNDPANKILIADSLARSDPPRAGKGYFREVHEIGDRHGGSANALFADFHVASVNRNSITAARNLKK